MTEATSRVMTGRRSWVAVAAGVAVALYAVLVPVQTVLSGTPLPLALLLGAALCGAVPAALVMPRTAVAVFGAAALLLPITVTAAGAAAAPWPWSVPALIAFASLVLVVAAGSGWRTGIAAWVVGAAASLVAPLARPGIGEEGAIAADLIVAASVAAGAYIVGVLIAARIQVGEELSRSRELTALEQSRRELVEERARIARELHDVVAHGLSVIQVQSSTARYRLDGLTEPAVAEFDDIAASARRSLTEMRRLLGVLRTDDDAPQLAPRAGIADISALVAVTRRAGVAVDLSVTGDVAAPPAAVQITAHRIVQEALSNAVRHAPGSAVTVTVTIVPERVDVTVRNTAPPGVPPSSPADSGTDSGHGLRGMRERAALVDGSVTAGPETGGGWCVAAVLPVAPDGPDGQEPA